MEPSIKENSIHKENLTGMECFTIQVAKSATLVAGKATPFTVLEFSIMKHHKIVKNKPHTGVSI